MVFNVKLECGNQTITRENSCGIVPANKTSPIRSYGNVTRGNFEGNPDIAGEGVIDAFMITSFVIAFFGLLLCCFHCYSVITSWKKRKPSKKYHEHPLCEKAHQLLDPIILSSSDAQALLIFAYWLSFQASLECSISGYHYTIVLHIILIGCTTSVLSIILVQKYFQKLVTSVLRIISATIMLFFIFGGFLKIQGASFDPLKIIPDKGTSDSDLFLPAFCLFDASSIEDSVLARNNLMRKTYVLLGILLAMSVLTHVVTYTLTHTVHKFKTKKTSLHIYAAAVIYFLQTTIYGILLILIVLAWSVIRRLRAWVDQSGWMNKKHGNPEMDILSIGQLAPLVALAAFGVPFSDKVSEWMTKKRKRGPTSNYIELERRQRTNA